MLETQCVVVLRFRLVPRKSRRCVSSRADASTGEIRDSSAIHGSSGARRSTDGFDSHDFADEICRVGTRAPCSRASTPATNAGSGSQGSANATAGAFLRRRRVEKRRQRRTRSDLTGRDELRNSKERGPLSRRRIRIEPCDRGVRGAEIDTNQNHW
jgi:hypothetical protein